MNIRIPTVSLLVCALLGSCSNDPTQEPSDVSSADDVGGDVPLEDSGSQDTDADSPDEWLTCETAAQPVTQALGEWTLDVAPDGSWALSDAETEQVLAGPGPCTDSGGLRVATGEAHANYAFGAFQITLDGAPSRLDWVGPDAWRQPTATDDEVLIQTRAGDATATLRFGLNEARDVVIEVTATGDDVTAGELLLHCAPDEAFFGLGTQVVGLNLRGRTFPLWTQEQGIEKPEDGGVFPLNNIPEATYAPMGVWHSSAGYSAVVTDDVYYELDLCETNGATLRLASYPRLPGIVLAPPGRLDGRLQHLAQTYLGVLQEPPPDWVFGPWNDSVGGPAPLREVAQILRDNAIPSNAIWSEDWIGGSQGATGYNLSYGWAWDPDQYPALAEDITWLHERGFAFLAYFNPFVPQPEPTFDEGDEGGYLMMDEEGETYMFQDPFFRAASMVDLTNPDALDWLAGYLRTAADDLAIDGWMADFAEWLPTDAVLASGETGWEAHNRYPLMWQTINRQVMEEVHADEESPNNWVYWARSGWASANGGTAGIAPSMWGGDQNTTWDYDDGLPTIVPIAVNAGLAGVAIFATDIAGYSALVNPATGKELFMRWSTLGAFHPLMRTHHGSEECANWTFERDDETLQHYRRWARVHTLLLPTFHRLWADAERGLPMMRHPALVVDQPSFWSDEHYSFFLGRDLLISPVLHRGETSHRARLPGPGWWPLFGSAAVTSGDEADDGSLVVDVEAPATELPVFVRPGSVVELLSEAPDTFYGATAEGVTDLSDLGDSVRLGLYPAADGGISETPTEYGAVSGGGWTMAPDWSAARLDGQTVDACGEEPVAPCYGPETLWVEGTDFTISVGDAELVVEGDAPANYAVSYGGAVWRELRQPTPLTELNPRIPGHCE